MRLLKLIAVIGFGVLLATGQTKPSEPSRHKLRQAAKEFEQGRKLASKGRLEEAYAAFGRAASLVPANVEYLSAREQMRERMVASHIQRGNALMDVHRTVEAAAEFAQALNLGPNSEFARQRLRDTAPLAPATPLASASLADEIRQPKLTPSPGLRDIHLRGPVTSILNSLAAAYGLKANVDPSVGSKVTEIHLKQADFATAVTVATQITHTFWMPWWENEILFAADTPQKHREFDRMQLRTFTLSEAGTPQEGKEIANLLRTLFEVRFLGLSAGGDTITVKAPAATMAAVTDFLQTLKNRTPQVQLEIEAFEINQSMLREFGVSLPLQFNVFNITASVLAALQGADTQALINQLISSGAINQANTTAIAALIAQLQSQQIGTLFQQPVATFGGGTTLMGVGIPPASVQLSLNESRATQLQRLTLRAAQGNAATMHIGQRHPILNATFAPIFASSAVTDVLSNQTFVAPFPSFNYEDLGITLKATPQVHGDRAVTLKMEMAIKALGTQNFNGVPVILNREYQGTITLKEGEPAVVVSSLAMLDQSTLTGIPGLSHVPPVSQTTSSRSRQVQDSELLIVITPHILSVGNVGASPVIVAPPAS